MGSSAANLKLGSGWFPYQEVVAGGERQIHDLSRNNHKPVSRVAVRQWLLLGGQHDLVGERYFPQRPCGLRQPLCQINVEANPDPSIERHGLVGRSRTLENGRFTKRSQQVFCYECLTLEGAGYAVEFNKLLALFPVCAST